MGDKMLPCGTPCSCSNVSYRVFPTRTLKDLLDKNLDIKVGSRPLRPILCRSLRKPYFQVVS